MNNNQKLKKMIIRKVKLRIKLIKKYYNIMENYDENI